MIKDFFEKLYPLTKVNMALALILSAFIIPGNVYGYSLIIVCGVISSFYGRLGIYAKRVFASLFLLTIVIFAAQGTLFASDEILMKFGIITVYKSGIMKAVSLTSKITAIVSVLTMLTLITDVKKFAVALEKKGVNPKAAFIILLTLQMIPEMKKQSAVILDSQRSRGVETDGNILIRMKAIVPVIVPLVLSSIANTEERAITLEARGFSIGKKRTILNDISETKNDTIMKIIILIFLVSCIIWRILWFLN